MNVLRLTINFIKKFVPKTIWVNTKLKKEEIKTRLYYEKVRLRYKLIAYKLRKKEKVKVAFFLIHDSVWKYEGLYRLMENDNRFEPIVIVCPYILYGEETMLNDMKQVYNSFKQKGYNVVKALNEKTGEWLDVKAEVKPDIVFFTNPHKLTRDEYYINNYLDCLTCYVPYSFQISHLYFEQYNQDFHNLLYKGYYETTIHKEIAYEHSTIKGRNISISGYPGLDNLIFSNGIDRQSLSINNKRLKKIIWAPHHTIENDTNSLAYSNFLKYADFMLELCSKYENKIEFIFKPHPILKAKLYETNDWGKEKTDKYYYKWENIPNGSLELGDYIELFNSSDAMIHDSGSFMVEYISTGKPALFTIKDNGITDRFNKFGKMAFQEHYKAYNNNDIESFIENVVVNEQDKLYKQRINFINTYLKMSDNKTASDRIFSDIREDLKIKLYVRN